MGFPEVLEVFMVSSYNDRVLCTKKVRATTFEAKYYPCEFFVMSIVVLFCWEETSGVESNGVNPIFVFLHNNAPSAKPEASVSMINCLDQSGVRRTRSLAQASFSH